MAAAIGDGSLGGVAAQLGTVYPSSTANPANVARAVRPDRFHNWPIILLPPYLIQSNEGFQSTNSYDPPLENADPPGAGCDASERRDRVTPPDLQALGPDTDPIGPRNGLHCLADPVSRI